MTIPDRAAFRDIYHRHSTLVYNLALHYLRDADEAEDAVQEVFVKVHAHLHEHDPSASALQTWIYRITVNHCLDVIKAKRTKKRFAFVVSLFRPDEKGELPDASHNDHPGALMEDAEAVRSLFTLIDRLPLNQRTALILTKIEGRSQQETAEIMQSSVKAVDSLVQRARSALSEMRRKPKE